MAHNLRHSPLASSQEVVEDRPPAHGRRVLPCERQSGWLILALRVERQQRLYVQHVDC